MLRALFPNIDFSSDFMHIVGSQGGAAYGRPLPEVIETPSSHIHIEAAVQQQSPLPEVLPADPSASTSVLVHGGWVPAITYATMAVGVILITRGKLSHGRSDSLAARRKLKKFQVSTPLQSDVSASLNDDSQVK